MINNSATCIIYNDRSQFVENLRAQVSSVETSHGTACSNYVGTIRIKLTTDEGTTIQYHIPGAIYAPDSPFNILGIPFFRSFLGQDNMPYPTQDDNGTYIISSASHSPFIWDHGQHEHHFCHNERSLPILFLETGKNYFDAFCTRVTRLYRNLVHYAFFLLIPSFQMKKPPYTLAREAEGSAMMTSCHFLLVILTNPCPPIPLTNPSLTSHFQCLQH